MSGDIPLTPEDVAEMVAILDGTAYDKVEIRTSRFQMRVAREGGGWTQEWDWADDNRTAAAAVAVEVSVQVEEELADGLVAIRAPLPGTFYRAPQPGAPPFVEPGSEVTEDTVVGIIETMKLMNPVHAGTRGVVEAVIVENGTMVDADAPLVRVRPLS